MVEAGKWLYAGCLAAFSRAASRMAVRVMGHEGGIQ